MIFFTSTPKYSLPCVFVKCVVAWNTATFIKPFVEHLPISSRGTYTSNMHILFYLHMASYIISNKLYCRIWIWSIPLDANMYFLFKYFLKIVIDLVIKYIFVEVYCSCISIHFCKDFTHLSVINFKNVVTPRSCLAKLSDLLRLRCGTVLGEMPLGKYVERIVLSLKLCLCSHRWSCRGFALRDIWNQKADFTCSGDPAAAVG